MSAPFRPIFVLGLARSGTNLLARMLDRHPSVVVALDPLMPVFRALRNAMTLAGCPPGSRTRFRPDLPFQDHYFDPDGPALLDALLTGDARHRLADDELPRLRAAVKDRASLESPALGERMARLEGATYGELVASALRVVGETRPDAAWVGVKEVWLFDFVPALARTFPDARFYAIERDPRAIVGSLVAMAERDPTQAAHAPSYMRHWRKSIALARRFAADRALAGRFRAIRYEDLVSDAEGEARRICGELEVPFTPAMLALSAEGWTGNSSFAHGGRDVYGGTAERWRETLPAEIAATTEFLCGPEMALAGYRRLGSGTLDDRVLGYLLRAGHEPGSWRSDSGDTVVDVGGELLRQALLGLDGALDEALVRRCFLLRETYEAVRRTSKGKGSE